MFLTTTTEKVQLVLGGAITTNHLQWTTSYADITTTAFTPGSNDGVSNNTTDVDIVAAPAASTQRQVKEITVYNADTASATVTVKFDDSGTERIYFKGTLSPGETLHWSQETGWSIVPESSVLRGDPAVCAGRLTLASGNPVPTSDQNAMTTVYLTPYKGNRIGLYDGSAWSILTFGETSVSLSGTSASTNYDVFGYNNGGTLALELVAWSSATARATAITLQDGVYCKSGDLTRRYLGTIRTTGSAGQCEDSRVKRFVFNNYNRVQRQFKVIETTGSWTYSSATIRQANANAANQVEFVVGLAEIIVGASIVAYHESSAGSPTSVVGFGFDSTTAFNDDGLFSSYAGAPGAYYHNFARIEIAPPIGYHYLAWLESSADAVLLTFYGDSLNKRHPGISGATIM